MRPNKVKVKDTAVKNKKSGHELYVMGLNAIIENEKEQGIKLLSESVEVDSNISDAFYHLGKLFLEKEETCKLQ